VHEATLLPFYCPRDTAELEEYYPAGLKVLK
jgi:hypothetical protein